MANTFVSPFVQSYKTQSAAATIALGGIGTATVTGAVAVATAGANGAVVTRLTAMPRATVAASSLVLFLVKASAPTVFNLIDSELMPAYTLMATTAIPETAFGNISNDMPLRLEAGDILYVGSQVALAAGIVFTAQWGNL
jgi:hypothetical protein